MLSKRQFNKHVFKAQTKGQAATEYIIILSIILIVILMIIGLLKGVLELRGGFETAKSRIEWASSDIALLAHTVYSNGTVSLLIMNNINYPVRIVAIGVDDEPQPYPGPVLYPGQEKEITFTSENIKDKPGTYYTHQLTLSYVHVQHPNLKKTVSGTIYGVVESE